MLSWPCCPLSAVLPLPVAARVAGATFCRDFTVCRMPYELSFGHHNRSLKLSAKKLSRIGVVAVALRALVRELAHDSQRAHAMHVQHIHKSTQQSYSYCAARCYTRRGMVGAPTIDLLSSCCLLPEMSGWARQNSPLPTPTPRPAARDRLQTIMTSRLHDSAPVWLWSLLVAAQLLPPRLRPAPPPSPLVSPPSPLPPAHRKRIPSTRKRHPQIGDALRRGHLIMKPCHGLAA
jgi:hypothetical protein